MTVAAPFSHFMRSIVSDQRPDSLISQKRLTDVLLVAILTATSMIVMLFLTSPELSWDEADYVFGISNDWSFLWHQPQGHMHAHGPMATYLAKLGQELLPAGFAWLEARLRFLEALVGSQAIGMLYFL